MGCRVGTCLTDRQRTYLMSPLNPSNINNIPISHNNPKDCTPPQVLGFDNSLQVELPVDAAEHDKAVDTLLLGVRAGLQCHFQRSGLPPVLHLHQPRCPGNVIAACILLITLKRHLGSASLPALRRPLRDLQQKHAFIIFYVFDYGFSHAMVILTNTFSRVSNVI